MQNVWLLVFDEAIKPILVKLETSCTAIVPSTVSALCLNGLKRSNVIGNNERSFETFRKEKKNDVLSFYRVLSAVGTQLTESSSPRVHSNMISNKMMLSVNLVLFGPFGIQHLGLNAQYSPVTPEPLIFPTFGLGSSLQILVANWKKYPCQFH